MSLLLSNRAIHLIKVFTLTLAAMLIQGCTTSRNIDNIGTHISNQYQLPSNYKDHRAQQQLFTLENGSQIAFTDHGEGDVLVLLHGVPTSSWMYRKMIPTLQNHFRVITIDLLGYGSSSKPENKNAIYSDSSQANYVQQLLNSLGVDNYSLLFHDMGGLVAWQMLRNDVTTENSKQHIDNLMVLNTIVREEGFNHPNFELDIFTRLMTDAYENRVTSALVLEQTFENMGLGEHELSEQECAGYVKPMTEGSSDALFAFYSHIDDALFSQLESNAAVFEKFTGETLVFWGAKDETLTTQQIPFLIDHLKIPDENVFIFENNAHFLSEEIPDILTNTIVKALR